MSWGCREEFLDKETIFSKAKKVTGQWFGIAGGKGGAGKDSKDKPKELKDKPKELRFLGGHSRGHV